MPHLLPGCLHWPGGSTQRGMCVHGLDRGRECEQGEDRLDSGHGEGGWTRGGKVARGWTRGGR